MRKWLNRLFPSPLISLMLIGVWCMLQRSYDLGTVLFSLLLAFFIPIFAANLRPRYVKVRKPWTIIKLFVIVTIDAWHSAWAVMVLLMQKVGTEDTSEFVQIPLDMRDPNGLAVLAIITCITPGNAWAELSMDRSMLLLHVLDGKVVPEEVIKSVKDRYERPLMEIFEQ